MKGQPEYLITLRPRQAAFVREYLVDLNATQAAVRAGYSRRAAAAIASENLRKPKIRQAIETAFEQRQRTAAMAGEEILSRLSMYGRATLSDYLTFDGSKVVLKPFSDLSEGAIACIKAIEPTPHGPRLILEDRQGALEKIGRHIGCFQAVGASTKIHVTSGMMGEGKDARLRNAVVLEAGTSVGTWAPPGCHVYLPDNGRLDPEVAIRLGLAPTSDAPPEAVMSARSLVVSSSPPVSSAGLNRVRPSQGRCRH